jgi:hypothetical protein
MAMRTINGPSNSLVGLAEPKPAGALAAPSRAIAPAAPLGIFDRLAAGGAAQLPGEHARADLAEAGHKRFGFRLDLGLVHDQFALGGLSQVGKAGDAGSLVSPPQDSLDGDRLHLLADLTAGHDPVTIRPRRRQGKRDTCALQNAAVSPSFARSWSMRERVEKVRERIPGVLGRSEASRLDGRAGPWPSPRPGREKAQPLAIGLRTRSSLSHAVGR